jgi:hypothetical protein
MKPSKHLNRRYMGFTLLLVAVMLTSACGNKLIRGAAPMVRMTELSHQGGEIMLQLNMRNPNGVELDILSIDFSLSVSNDKLFAYKGPVNTVIVVNGTETWSEKVEESQATRDLLDQLQNGDIKSLPYTLKGAVTSREDGILRFEHEGHIYPLPGRPGHFR